MVGAPELCAPEAGGSPAVPTGSQSDGAPAYVAVWKRGTKANLTDQQLIPAAVHHRHVWITQKAAGHWTRFTTEWMSDNPMLVIRRQPHSGALTCSIKDRNSPGSVWSHINTQPRHVQSKLIDIHGLCATWTPPCDATWCRDAYGPSCIRILRAPFKLKVRTDDAKTCVVLAVGNELEYRITPGPPWIVQPKAIVTCAMPGEVRMRGKGFAIFAHFKTSVNLSTCEWVYFVCRSM